MNDREGDQTGFAWHHGHPLRVVVIGSGYACSADAGPTSLPSCDLIPAIGCHAKKEDSRGSSPLATSKGQINIPRQALAQLNRQQFVVAASISTAVPWLDRTLTAHKMPQLTKVVFFMGLLSRTRQLSTG